MKLKTKKVFVETQAQHHIRKVLQRQIDLEKESISLGDFCKEMSLYFLLITLRGAALGAVSGTLGASVLRLFDSSYQIKPSILANTTGGAALMFPLVLLKFFMTILFPHEDKDINVGAKLSASFALAAIVGSIGNQLIEHEKLESTMTASQQALVSITGVAAIKSTNYVLERCFGPK